MTAELQRCAEEAESTLEGLRMTHGRVQAQLRAERGERGVSITGYPTAVYLEGAVTHVRALAWNMGWSVWRLAWRLQRGDRVDNTTREGRETRRLDAWRMVTALHRTSEQF